MELVLSSLFKDLQLGARLLFKNPGHTLVVTLTLALAIGANTIVFAFTELLLLRPLPFGDPNRVVFLYSVNTELGLARSRTSLPDFLDWRAQTTTFEDMAAFENGSYTLTGRGEPIRVSALRTTANLFSVWGLPAVAGQTFSPGDDRPGARKVVVLSHRFWMGHFNGQPEAIGSNLTLNGEPYTILGVLTPSIEVANFEGIDLWLPLPLDASGARRDGRTLRVTARLKPGGGSEEASAEIRGIAHGLEQTYPTSNAGWTSRVLSMRYAIVGPEAWQIITLLTIIVGFVLLVACANVANMMLARSTTRQKEMAVRIALGATRARLVRQTMTESLLLGLVGGVMGLAVTYGGIRGIQSLSPDAFFRLLTVNRNLLLFTFVLAVVAPLLFSVLPALQTSRTDLNEELKGAGARLSGGPAARRVRSTLVISQLALSLALLVVATLVTRSVVAIEFEPRGVQTSNVLTVSVNLESARYSDLATVGPFTERATERLSALPGVRAAAAATSLPLVASEPTTRFTIVNKPRPASKDTPWANQVAITPDYIQVFDLAVRSGRPFTRYDRGQAPNVALVNREAVRRYWPNESPIGQHVQYEELAGTSHPIEVVGVVDDVKAEDPSELPPPRLYRPFAQRLDRRVAFALRTEADPGSVAAGVRQALHEIDPDVALSEMRPLERIMREIFSENYVLVGLFASFAFVALVLAGTGLYGVTAYSVGQRTREIGIRMALGASRRRVLSLVLGQNARLVIIGALVGIAGGIGFGRSMRSILFRVGPDDPFTFVAVLAILSAVSLVASYLPARRASRINPLAALHHD